MQAKPYWVYYTATHNRKVKLAMFARAQAAHNFVRTLRTGSQGACYTTAYVYYCNSAHGG